MKATYALFSYLLLFGTTESKPKPQTEIIEIQQGLLGTNIEIIEIGNRGYGGYGGYGYGYPSYGYGGYGYGYPYYGYYGKK